MLRVGTGYFFLFFHRFLAYCDSLNILTDCILRSILITLKLYGKGVQCGEDSIRMNKYANEN